MQESLTSIDIPKGLCYEMCDIWVVCIVCVVCGCYGACYNNASQTDHTHVFVIMIDFWNHLVENNTGKPFREIVVCKYQSIGFRKAIVSYKYHTSISIAHPDIQLLFVLPFSSCTGS